MYYTIKNNEDKDIINEYLLLKEVAITTILHDDVIDRIFYYKKERLYKIITKNIYELPNNRRTYYWFDKEEDLDLFIKNITQTTINKYKHYYYDLYNNFQTKLDNFVPSFKSRIENSVNIDEQKSLTFTYYNLEKYTNLFKHKYETLLNWNKNIFLNYDSYEYEIKSINLQEPTKYIEYNK